MNRFATMVLAGVGAVSGFALAAEDAGKVYRFGTDEKHTNVTFVSEADVENIYGSTHAAKGQTWIDFDALKGKCSISVPVSTMKTGVDLRDEHLRSDAWLDAEQFPDITLSSTGFDLVEKNKAKGIYETKFKGKLTIHGVTKDLETTVKVVKISAEMAKVFGDGGDWVRVTAGFDVTLKDFNVTIPDGPVVAKVSPTWTVKFDCYATTAK